MNLKTVCYMVCLLTTRKYVGAKATLINDTEKVESGDRRQEFQVIQQLTTDSLLKTIMSQSVLYSDEEFDNVGCISDLLLVKQGVSKWETWALKMLDSSAKLPAGILIGNEIQLGNYDECVAIEEVESDFGQFRGQSCLVSIDCSSWHLKLAVCVPSSCSSSDLEILLGNNSLGKSEGISFTVDPLSCSTAELPVFTTLDWFAVGVVALFGGLVALSTTYDLLSRKSGPKHCVLLAFSALTNVGTLMRAKQPKRYLTAAEGIRVISTIYIVLHHYAATVLYDGQPISNRDEVKQLLSSWFYAIVMGQSLPVDSFLLLSGMLVSFNFLGQMQKGKPFNVLRYYLHRYIRLTPPYAVMMLLTATLFIYMGSGPIWMSSMEIYKILCQRNWWTNFLYVSNYVDSIYTCLPQTWYLSVDMQLFWISPLLLIPLWRWQLFGKWLLALSFIAGLLIAFLVPYFFKLTEGSFTILLDQAKTSDLMAQTYIPTHIRFTPWLIGLVLGYMLHHRRDQRVKLAPGAVAVGWLLSSGLMLTSLLLYQHFQNPDHENDRLSEAMFFCLMRPAWALGLAWIVFACAEGYGGFVNNFLSSRFFQVLSRLTYCVYLCHTTIIKSQLASIRTLQDVSITSIITEALSGVVISFAFGFLLHIVVEVPASILENHAFAKWDQMKNEATLTETRRDGPQELTQL